MSERMIPFFPSKEQDLQMLRKNRCSFDEYKRYLAENHVVRIEKDSSVADCANAFSELIKTQIEEINDRFEDERKSRIYSNPFELISEESKRSEKLKMQYTGNIAKAHEQIDYLNEKIESAKTPKQLLKPMLLYMLVGLLFLGFAVYSCFTGAAVEMVKWIISSGWFTVLFSVAVIVLSFMFGVFAMGVLIVGGVILVGLIVFKFPVLAAVIINGLLFLLAILLISTAIEYLKKMKKHKPLSQLDQKLTQSYIKERETLCRELKEYSDIMLNKISIIKDAYYDHQIEFYEGVRKQVKGEYNREALITVFTYLNKYYTKMKRYDA